MSTDLRDRTTHPSPDEGGEPEKPKPSLSVTQVVGGALAAMTAAALGSRLSLAGTVLGAALASVVAAVGGAVYTASLRRTSKHVTKVIQKTRTHGGGQAAAGPVAPPRLDPTSTDAGVDPVDATDDRGWPTQVLPAVGTGGDSPDARPATRRIGWKPVVVGALLMFAIAAVALTGLELATGHALSGGSGTTVGQVSEGRTAPTSKPKASTAATPSATPTARSTPSATASSTPSSAPTAAPSSSATAAPSATPTATPTATPLAPSAVPSGVSTP